MSSYEEIISRTAQSIRAKELVVFCGAGISIDSGIPGVVTIVEYILMSIGMKAEDIGIFVEKNNISDLTVPFEVLMDQLLEACGNKNILKLFRMFDSDQLRPNLYHWFLAGLARAGLVKMIFTTNFDCLIEDALKEIGVAFEPLYLEEDFERLKSPTGLVRVVKIHGSVRDPNSMVSTIRRLSQEHLRNQRNIAVENCFSSGHHSHVLVLGYSCSDIFDISSQIECMTANLKEVTFTDHIFTNDIRVESLSDKKEKNPFRHFTQINANGRLYCPTTPFIRLLWKELKPELGDVYEEKRAKESALWKQAVADWNRVVFAQDVRGRLFFDKGRCDHALVSFTEGLEQRKKVLGDTHKDTGTSYNNLGRVYDAQGDYAQAIKNYKKALEISKNTVGDRHINTAISYNNLGGVFGNQGDWGQATEYLKKGHEITKKILEDMRLETVNSHENLGGVYHAQGNEAQAIENYKKALENRKKDIGDVHPDIATGYNVLGVMYDAQGDYARAIEHHEKALKVRRTVLGDTNLETADSYNNLGILYYTQGDHERSIENFKKVTEIKKKCLGDVHRGTADSYNNLGLVYDAQGDYTQAIEYYQKALEIRKKVLGEAHPDTANIYNNLGVVYEAQDAYAKAIDYYEKALESLKEIFPDGHPNMDILSRNLNMIKHRK